MNNQNTTILTSALLRSRPSKPWKGEKRWLSNQLIKGVRLYFGPPNYTLRRTTGNCPINGDRDFLTHLLTKGIIDEDYYSFLVPPSNCRTPTFYMLPKIHKEGCPSRPIISGCQSPTVALSQYLDFPLKPIVKETPSYIKDTNHFLQTVFNLQTEIKPDNILVTMDVKSLYTNILQDLGIQYCLDAMQNF